METEIVTASLGHRGQEKAFQRRERRRRNRDKLIVTGCVSAVGAFLFAAYAYNEGWIPPEWIELFKISADQDGDGLSDYKEQAIQSVILNPDTDADGIVDGQDIHPLVTDKVNIDPSVPIVAGQADYNLGSKTLNITNSVTTGVQLDVNFDAINRATNGLLDVYTQTSIPITFISGSGENAGSRASVTWQVVQITDANGNARNEWRINNDGIQINVDQILFETAVLLHSKYRVSTGFTSQEWVNTPGRLALRGWSQQTLEGMNVDQVCSTLISQVVLEELIELALMQQFANTNPAFLQAANNVAQGGSYAQEITNATRLALQLPGVQTMPTDGTSDANSDPGVLLTDKLSLPFVRSLFTSITRGDTRPLITCNGLMQADRLMQYYVSLLNLNPNLDDVSKRQAINTFQELLSLEEKRNSVEIKTKTQQEKKKRTTFVDKEENVLNKLKPSIEDYQFDEIRYIYENKLNRKQRRALISKAKKLEGNALLDFIQYELGIQSFGYMFN